MDEQLYNMTLQELGKRMQEARKRQNKKRKAEGKTEMTQKKLAKLLHVSDVTISEWEQGKMHPGFLNVLKYCGVLGISLDELLGKKEEKIFSIQFTEGERNTILAILEECKQADNKELQGKLHFFDQYLNTFFNRAQST